MESSRLKKQKVFFLLKYFIVCNTSAFNAYRRKQYSFKRSGSTIFNQGFVMLTLKDPLSVGDKQHSLTFNLLFSVSDAFLSLILFVYSFWKDFILNSPGFSLRVKKKKRYFKYK